jgi:hypothetical protein
VYRVVCQDGGYVGGCGFGHAVVVVMVVWQVVNRPFAGPIERKWMMFWYRAHFKGLYQTQVYVSTPKIRFQ